MTPDPLGARVERLLRTPRAAQAGAMLADLCDIGATALDLGCGAHSAIRAFAPRLRLVGIDSNSSALEKAARRSTHDALIRADITTELERVAAAMVGEDVQLVVLFHVIEHFPKRVGLQLLEQVEALTSRFVLVDTPNGFLPQGPEYENEAQRHLSGWFPHDFVGLGYSVRGTGGTRLLRGYAGQPALPIRGGQTLDFLLAWLLRVKTFPRFAYNLTAWKDVRGVAARLG